MRTIASLAFAFLASCATGYHSKGFSGGWSSTELGRGVYRITFSGNGRTDSERATDFALLRAADLCRQIGASRMAVSGLGGSSRASLITTKNTYTGEKKATIVSKPTATLTARCASRGSGQTLSVHRVISSITKKYDIDKDDLGQEP